MARGRRLLTELCRDLDQAIRSAGLTYVAVGRAIGLSADQVARICHGQLDDVGIARLATLLATVGLELGARAYPGGDPIRDAPQRALLGRFVRNLSRRVPIRYEVPVVDTSSLRTNDRSIDRRAWDAVLAIDGKTVAVEAETRLVDVQSLLRRLHLKRRDGNVDRLILLCSDTVGNRHVRAVAADQLRAEFPGDARIALRALRASEVPAADTLLFL